MVRGQIGEYGWRMETGIPEKGGISAILVCGFICITKSFLNGSFSLLLTI